MDRTHLNEHDANLGAQSKGEFLGMTGNSGWYLLGSAGASILIVILFWGVLGFSLLLCLFLGVVLCLLSVAYVFTLKNNKPEHYDTDFFESALIEAGMIELVFGPRARRPANPFALGADDVRVVDPSPPRPATSAPRSARINASSSPNASARQPVNGAPSEMKRRVTTPREEPVVPLASYEHLREELDTAEEMLEDALLERGEI